MPTAFVFRREFKSYFTSPIAYIVIVVFLVVTGWFFFSTFFLQGRADLRGYFDLLPLVLSFVIPAVCMRLFSEERANGSYEMLLTLPVSAGQILAGKFLAALAFVAVMLAPTIAYPISVSFFGNLDWGPAVGGFIGALFLSAAYTAIGTFASSLTRNQIVAFIVATAICFFLWFVDKVLFLVPGFLTGVLAYIGADYHFKNIAKGIVDSRDLIYFLSVTFVGLYATYLVVREQ